MNFKKISTFQILRWLRHASISITLFWTLVIGLSYQLGLQVLYKFELQSINWRFHWRGERSPHPDVLIIGIDNNSLKSSSDYSDETFENNPDLKLLKQWPFPRRVHAKIIEKLAAAGCKCIVFDLLFINPSNDPEDDKILKEAIEKHKDIIVLGGNFTNDRMFDSQVQLPYETIIPDNVEEKEITGLVNYVYDQDLQIRFAITEFLVPGDVYYSIDGLAVHKAFPHIQLPKPGTPHFINFSGPVYTYPVIDFYQLVDPVSRKLDHVFYTGAKVKGWDVFKNKIVLIGPKGNFQHDSHPSPFGDSTIRYKFHWESYRLEKDVLEELKEEEVTNPIVRWVKRNYRQHVEEEFRKPMDGVEIHANVIGTLLSGDRIREFTKNQVVATILISGIAFAFLLNRPQTVWKKLIPMFVLSLTYGVFCQWMFVRYQWVLPFMSIEIIFIFSTMGTILFQATMDQMERRRVSGMLQRYVSKNIADELIKSGEDFRRPKKRTVTILFSDVRDFTTMTENSEPGPFVQQLNEYLTAMVECVFNNKGTVDKFVGDAVMAVFGNPKSFGVEEDAWCAVKTAVEMRKRLAELNDRWAKEGRAIYRFGIGINQGEVMAGDIGSIQKAEFGVIGDAVNVAARVESLTKEQKVDILITDAVYQLVKDRVEVEHRGDMSVKGRGKPVDIYALKGLREEAVSGGRQQGG